MLKGAFACFRARFGMPTACRVRRMYQNFRPSAVVPQSDTCSPNSAARAAFV